MIGRHPDPGVEAAAALEAHAGPAAHLMRLLANEHRLIMMCRLVQKECSVGELADHAGLSQSACSQHLKLLRDADMIRPRRASQTIHYSIAGAKTARIIALLCDIYGEFPEKGRAPPTLQRV